MMDQANKASGRRFFWGMLIVISWAAAFGPRPFMLGFYHDDWSVLRLITADSQPFSWERLRFFMGVYANRPGTGLLTFALSSVCNDSALMWQAALAVLALGAALPIFPGSCTHRLDPIGRRPGMARP